MKLLFVKLGAIGDGVMALEALARVQGLEITWVSGNGLAPLVSASGLVKETISVDESRFYHGGFFTRLREVAKIWWRLKFRRFDACVVAYRDRRYGIFSWFSCTKRKVFFTPVPGRFHGDELFLLIQKLLGRDLFPSERREATIPRFQGKSRSGKFTVAIAPGGARNILRDDALRRWPLDRYHELAEVLLRAGAEVVYTGGPQDLWVRDGMPAGVIDEIGKYDLLQLVERFQSCSVVVTHDSGPMHLARLANVPVAALFGPTIPSEKVRGGNTKIFWGGESLACRPCYNGQSYAACADNICMRQIAVDAVANWILGLRERV